MPNKSFQFLNVLIFDLILYIHHLKYYYLFIIDKYLHDKSISFKNKLFDNDSIKQSNPFAFILFTLFLINIFT
jgi:hypothetical protein